MTFGTGIANSINRNGRTVTLRRVNSGEGVYDPASDTYTPPGAPTETPTKAVITSVSAALVQATEGILITDKRVVVGDFGWSPTNGDEIVDGSDTLKVVAIAKKVMLGDTLVGWVLVGRA